MISIKTFPYLIANKMRDARILMENRRFPAAVYIAGYAVEIALKYRICRTLGFTNGFPETKEELRTYLAAPNATTMQTPSIEIWDIRNHDLGRLLFHAGMKDKIETHFQTEWNFVLQWDPANRYRKVRTLENYAIAFLKAAKKIMKEID